IQNPHRSEHASCKHNKNPRGQIRHDEMEQAEVPVSIFPTFFFDLLQHGFATPHNLKSPRVSAPESFLRRSTTRRERDPAAASFEGPLRYGERVPAERHLSFTTSPPAHGSHDGRQ